MAFTIQSVTPLAYDPTLDFKTDQELIGLALGGSAQAAARVVRDGADFTVQCRTTAAETGAAIELLTARGVQFPAGFQRVIDVEAFVSGDATNERGWINHIVLVTGGSTPVVQTTILTQGSTAGTAGQAPSNFLSAMAAGGFGGAPALTVTAGAGTVTCNVVSGEAEILNWTVRVKVGRLLPFIAGV